MEIVADIFPSPIKKISNVLSFTLVNRPQHKEMPQKFWPMYEVFSKRIWPSFFPQKQIKHRRCPPVRGCRRPSWACVNFPHPQRASLADTQPGSEWVSECSECKSHFQLLQNYGNTWTVVLHQILLKAWWYYKVIVIKNWYGILGKHICWLCPSRNQLED